MATPPIVCDTIQFEGAIFQRCNLSVIKGTTVLREIHLLMGAYTVIQVLFLILKD